jgi:hypothetical protein
LLREVETRVCSGGLRTDRGAYGVSARAGAWPRLQRADLGAVRLTAVTSYIAQFGASFDHSFFARKNLLAVAVT